MFSEQYLFEKMYYVYFICVNNVHFR